MAENPITPEVSFDFSRYFAQERAYAERNEALRPANKAALFDALARAGITSVLVRFDGEGDSGQIEEIDALCGEAPAELPSGEIAIAEPVWGSPEIRHVSLSVRDALGTLAFNLLEQTWRLGERRWRLRRFHVRRRGADHHPRLQRAAHRNRLLRACILKEGAMAHCYHHALSSVKKWGGTVEDFIELHQWLGVIWTVKPF